MSYRAICDPTRWVASTSTETDVLYPASQVLTDGSLTLAKQANMATASVVYRKTAGAGPPEVQSLATLKTDLGLSGTNTGDQDLSSLAPKASPVFSGLVGVGMTAVNIFDITGNSATTLYGKILNTNSAGTEGWQVQNDAGDASEFGVRGSARGAYGALVARDGYMYANSSFTIMADAAGGVLKFAAGGNTERLRIDALGSVVMGAGLATNATDGFLYIPSCAGAPTGTPTTYTNRLALVYDRTNNNFYIYNGGWKKVTLA